MSSTIASDLWSSVISDVALARGGSGIPLPPTPIQQRRRRGFVADDDSGEASVQLARSEDDVLRWVYEPPVQRRAGARRTWRSSTSSERDVVQRYVFPELGENEITAALERLDFRLNRRNGLHLWHRDPADPLRGSWQPISADQAGALKGRALLLIHGTFSSSDMYNSELLAAPTSSGASVGGTPGQRLWQSWTDPGHPYGALLAFDHPTLSMAPWLNALKLTRALGGTRAEIDVLCHSRGGLVASWALCMNPMPFRQVVFVGSPLMGTSLAAPNRLRAALDVLANVANAVSITSTGAATLFPPAAPLALGAAGLAQALGRTLQLGAAVPLADAAVGLVPGLLAQSRVGNNIELRELGLKGAKTKLRGMGVVFKPDEVRQPAWKFWKRFSNLGSQGLYYVGDMIFQQPNDLVVDFDSMDQLELPQPGKVVARLTEWESLGESSSTHHCSYFRDEKAIAKLEAWLQ